MLKKSEKRVIMQKNLAQATEALAESLNELHSEKKANLFDLIKQQASEIEKRGKIIVRLESSVEIQQKNIEKLLQQNNHLENLILSMKEERMKLLEETECLKTAKLEKPRRQRKEVKDADRENSA